MADGLTRKVASVRGMHDVLPGVSGQRRRMERAMIAVLESYGYREIRLPLLERTELFARSIGEQTDVVSKEMYTFEDRSGERLTLRPEGTAGCVRAGLAHGLFRGSALRLWYVGPMFRYERPQQGRYRQFHQIGVETFGLAGPDIDGELAMLCQRLWQRLRVPGLTLEINSLGGERCRRHYRDRLVEYFQAHSERLSLAHRRRLRDNPLRLLDSKDEELAELIAQAPPISDCWEPETLEAFAGLRALLDARELPYRLNPRLVRGLDYYTGTVFEWTSERLGAQNAVCAGGRYDGLVQRLGGPATPAAGFAIGLERLSGLCEPDESERLPHAYLVAVGRPAETAGMVLAETLRDRLPWLRLIAHCGGGSLKSQFAKADRCDARYALILAERELAEGTVGVKPLREDRPQLTVPRDELARLLAERLAEEARSGE